MKRAALLDAIRSRPEFDLVVIGGGATGLGAAVDAAARGYRVALFERDDFAKETSSRSTKLIHDGVRYLRQGNLSMVFGALRERGRLMRNAPHLVRPLRFVIPVRQRGEGLLYGMGLTLYDALAGREGFGPSRRLALQETVSALPTLERSGLRGGVAYYDAQFDDARLAIALARTCFDLGGCPVNYTPVTGLVLKRGRVRGVRVRDAEGPADVAFEVHARAVINATGVFADAVRRFAEPGTAPEVACSRGVHLVLPRRFLPGADALMVPRTDDGRVFFAVPWQERVIVGTTDTAVERPETEPQASASEIRFLLDHAARHLVPGPQAGDLMGMFAGLRPLIRPPGDRRPTAALPRDHLIRASPAGLVTVTGGKWTTYRQMAEEVVDCAAVVGDLAARPCPTRDLPVHGAADLPSVSDALGRYGTDAAGILDRVRANPALGERIHPRLPYLRVELVHAVHEEMARTAEDFLARRTRALVLDARAAIEAAPAVAGWMAAELGRDAEWAADQAEAFCKLARSQLPPDV